MNTLILIVNSGSTSLKFKIFEKENLAVICQGLIERIGLLSSVFYYAENKEKTKVINYSGGIKNHEIAVKLMVEILPQEVYDQIKIIGHRVVHGGEEFIHPTPVNQQILKKLAKYNELAPLHNPVNLKTIEICLKYFNEVKNIALFDTAFFRTLPNFVYLYSLPLKFYEQHKIRKYGFHGLSHENMLFSASKQLKKKINDLNLITCHLGGGSSITLIKNGRAFDTSMGFTPLEGVTMSTRSGDLDPAIIIYLEQKLKMTPTEILELLNFQSGIYGLSGIREMKDLLQAAGYQVKGYKLLKKYNKREKEKANLALKIFIYNIQRYINSYACQVKKLDAIVFSGAIGYHSEIIRKLILKDIYLPSRPKILICEPNEELIMVKEIIKLF